MADAPGLRPLLEKSNIDYAYYTQPEPQTGNRSQYWPRGKVLGGSSVLSAQRYIRGLKQDYDGWEKLGNKGWSWKDVLPYFKKSEDNKNPDVSTTIHLLLCFKNFSRRRF